MDYNLRVLELQPAAAVSVIETDIAADVGPSIETEGYLRAQAEAAAREAERQRQAQEQAERQAAEVTGAGGWLGRGWLGPTVWRVHTSLLLEPVAFTTMCSSCQHVRDKTAASPSSSCAGAGS